MITIKLKLKEKQTGYQKLMKQFNNVVRFAYNRYCDNQGKIKDSDVAKLVKTTMNNIEQMDASFIQIAVQKAKSIYNASKDKKVVFGGKNSLKRYMKGLITKEQFVEQRQFPLSFIGRKSDGGNRKFSLDLKNHRIIFKKSKFQHYDLNYCSSKNQDKILFKWQDRYDKKLKDIKFTVQLNKEYVFLVFDQKDLEDKTYKPIKDRIASIDQNPNYISLVIRDGKKLKLKVVYSLKNLNDLDNPKKYKEKENKTVYRKHLQNKRRYETFEIAKRISEVVKQYRCEYMVLEDLSISSSNKKKGKRFNKLVNNFWLRKSFSNNLKKRCNLIGIKVQEVFAGYSSIKGQLQNQNEVDSIAAAIEIGKRINKDLKDFGDTKVEIGNLIV